MTVSNTKNKIQYAGDGVTQLFVYDFLVPTDTDMVVTVDGAIISSGYVVNGAGVPTGGDVTFDTAPLSGTDIVLVRSIPATQEMDLRPYDAFPADSVEDAFDKLTLLVQDLSERASRAVVADITYPPNLVLEMPPYAAGYGIQWNPNVVNDLELTSVPISQITSDALVNADRAELAAINAVASESAALGYSARASEWANNPEDVPVLTGPNQFSAFHWAKKAEGSAIGNVLAVNVQYDDTITSWGVAELQAAMEFIEASFPRAIDVYTKAETYDNTEVYNKTETYTQAEVDALVPSATDVQAKALAWVSFGSTGNIIRAYNCTVARLGVGAFRISVTSPPTGSPELIATGTARVTSAATGVNFPNGPRPADTVDVDVLTFSPLTNADPERCDVIIFGNV